MDEEEREDFEARKARSLKIFQGAGAKTFAAYVNPTTGARGPCQAGWTTLKKSTPIEPGQNVMVLCGPPSDLMVIDFDVKDRGMEIWELGGYSELLKGYPMVQTGGGGIHVYLPYDERLKTGTKCVTLIENGVRIKVGIDIRSKGGNAIAPPSIHHTTKKQYKFMPGFKAALAERKPMPEELYKIFTTPLAIDEGGNLDFADPLDTLPADAFSNCPKIFPVSKSYDAEIYRRLLFGLDINRCIEYDMWISICFAMGTVAKQAHQDLSGLVDEWSQQAGAKYDKAKTLKAYSMSNGRIGAGSLWLWLRSDNEELYEELVNLHQNRHPQDFYYDDYKQLLVERKAGTLAIEKVKAYYRATHAVVDDGGNKTVFTKTMEEGQESWKQVQFMTCVNNRLTAQAKTDESKAISFGQLFEWMLDDNELPVYSSVVFRPYMVAPEGVKTFNLFKPYPFKYKQEWSEEQAATALGVVQPFINHIHNELCKSNPLLSEFYLNSLAHLIQKPWEKPQNLIVFITQEGAGKDMINYDMMARTIGSWNIAKVNNASDLTRKFNKSLDGVFVVILGEVQEFSARVDAERLKEIITSPTINIEPKGKDPYTIKSCHRFIGNTNQHNCLAPSVNDRRSVIIECWKTPQPREYFNNMFKLIADDTVVEAWFDYLSHRDISEFNPKVLPVTDIKKQLAYMHMPAAHRFFIEYIKNGDKTMRVHADSLYMQFESYCKEAGESMKPKRTTFLMSLARLLPEARRITIGGTARLGYTIDKQDAINAIQQELKIEVPMTEEQEQDSDVNIKQATSNSNTDDEDADTSDSEPDT